MLSLKNIFYLSLVLFNFSCMAYNNKFVEIKNIQKNIDNFFEKEVVLEVFYGNPNKENLGMPYTRSDWMIYDKTASIYVSGKLPVTIERYGQKSWGTPLKIRGVVKKTDRNTPYIRVITVELR